MTPGTTIAMTQKLFDAKLVRRAGAVGTALLLDHLTPEPPNVWHPVAWFGSAMTKLENRVWANSRTRGSGYAIAGFACGALVGRTVRSTTVALTVALGGASLRSTASEIGAHLEDDQLERARTVLPSLVGRNPSELDASGIASAVVESVAENAVDAVVAPAFWAFVAGAPGALGYRAINTMDAMVGHHNPRFEQFGWTSARLDDIANFIPARLFAGAVWIVSPKQRNAIARAVQEDAPAHPSPNAGVAESSVAAAIGVELGGPLQYGDKIENRPLLGVGPRPNAASIPDAIRTTDKATVFLAAAAGACAVLAQRKSR